MDKNRANELDDDDLANVSGGAENSKSGICDICGKKKLVIYKKYVNGALKNVCASCSGSLDSQNTGGRYS